MKIDRSGKASILSPSQINLLFSDGFKKSRDKALFAICLYTAARINEACTLNYRDVIGTNGVRSVMIIRAINTKGKLGTREIQVHPHLKTYLEDYIPEYKVRGKNPHLFPGRHGLGHIHSGSADAILRDACNHLGIEGVSTHSFRRTALTTMSNAGIPLRHIQDISGHRTLSALERYLGVTDEQRLSAIHSLVF
jgi:integrase/recombinase XerD